MWVMEIIIPMKSQLKVSLLCLHKESQVFMSQWVMSQWVNKLVQLIKP